jgi:hypothetical protein
MLMLGMLRFRLGCTRPTGESMRTSLISTASPVYVLFQWFGVVVNNMRANVAVLPYDDHDRVVKLVGEFRKIHHPRNVEV